jgi:transaldolase
VQGYIEKNENIINFIEEIKEKKQTSKTKINENKKMVKKQKETVRKFGLDVEDIENIFDILEKEHPNL